MRITWTVTNHSRMFALYVVPIFSMCGSLVNHAFHLEVYEYWHWFHMTRALKNTTNYHWWYCQGGIEGIASIYVFVLLIEISIDPITFFGTSSKWLQKQTIWGIHIPPYAHTASSENKTTQEQRYIFQVLFIIKGFSLCGAIKGWIPSASWIHRISFRKIWK